MLVADLEESKEGRKGGIRVTETMEHWEQCSRTEYSSSDKKSENLSNDNNILNKLSNSHDILDKLF